MKTTEQILAQDELMREALKEDARLFERLDEAMASPERIAEDTRLVGGFVSGLDLIETAEQIVDRAIAIIKQRTGK